FERDPLPAVALARLDYPRLLAPCGLPDALLAWATTFGDVPPPGRHRFARGAVTLELVVGDARAADLPASAYDAVYLDPFSPRANPDGWEADLLGRLVGALRPRGRLVTYSVSGEV